MISFDDLIKNSGDFQAMITMLEPLMTTPEYTKYFTPVFNDTKDWKGIEKSVGFVPMASSIDRHSGKPIVETSAPIYTYGQLPSWGNIYPMTSDELEELRKIEKFYMDNVVDKNGGAANQTVIDQLLDQRTQMLRKKFDPIARMPLAAIDKLAFEEWSNGTATIDRTKMKDSLPFQVDFQIKKYHVPTVWSDSTNANALKDLDAFANRVWKDLHIRIDTLAMNHDEVRKILAQKSTQEVLTTSVQSMTRKTKVTGIPSLEDVDIILEGQYKIPTITEINAQSGIAGDGGDIVNLSETFNSFQDGRVAGSLGTNLGEYIYCLSPEQRMPDNSYQYATSQGNVLLSVLSKKGELSIESDLSAMPVLTMRKSMAILVTDDTVTGDALYD